MSASELVERDEHVFARNGFPSYYVPYKPSDHFPGWRKVGGA